MKTMLKIMAQLLPLRNIGLVSHSLIMVLPKGEMWLLLAIITTVCPKKTPVILCKSKYKKINMKFKEI